MIASVPNKTWTWALYSILAAASGCQSAAAEETMCQLIAEVVSEPIRDGLDYEFSIVGRHSDDLPSGFCSDRIDNTTTIRLTVTYYKSLGAPQMGDTVLLTEYKKVEDFGEDGVHSWRYFKRSPDYDSIIRYE